MSRTKRARRARPVSVRPRRHSRPLWSVVGLAALLLLFTIDDRYPGAIADGRQMSWTAVAIAETGEIGQARGRDFNAPRQLGDAVTRFGLGMSLLQVPAAWAAPAVESRFGPGSSQPLFLIAPLLAVCVSAAAAGWIALQLGLGSGAMAAAALLTAIGSPLGAYAALDLSEPVQACALALACAFALASTSPERSSRRAAWFAALAGVSAGYAVLTKTSLLAVAPFATLPLLAAGGPLTRPRRIAAALIGATPVLAAWGWLEFARFGQLLGGYGGEGFTHPILDGLWRLLVGPNRGMLFYFPAVALAIAALFVSIRTEPTWTSRRRLTLFASLGVFLALLALAAPWWAWHGLWGWGPRLVVPAIPLLAAGAALTLESWPRSARIAVVVLSVFVNLPGLLQNAAPVSVFTASCEWPPAERNFAQSLAPYASRQDPDGTFRVPPDQILEKVARASPFVVFPWFAAATRTDAVSAAKGALQQPPWHSARPEIRCDARDDDFIRRLLRRAGWPVWGRGFSPDPAAPGVPGVYDEGLLDQVVRAQQLERPEQALELARKLASLAPSGEADALVLESFRLRGWRAEAAEYLASVPPERKSEPRINVVLALFERDAGNETMARQLLGSVAASFPGTPAPQAVDAPLSAWPRDLHQMTALPTDQARGTRH